MKDKEKLEKLKKLADAMYYSAQHLTTDASRLHKTMDEYHKFVIHECKEEPVSELEEAAREYAGIPEDSPHDLKYCVQDKKAKYNAVLYGANWQKEEMLAKAVDVTIAIPYPNGYGGYTQLVDSNEALPFGDNIKVLVIKEE